MNNHSTHTETRASVSARIRDLSPGALYDLILGEAGRMESSPLVARFAPAEAQSLVGDLVRMQACFASARDLYACSGGSASALAASLPQGQLLDLFLDTACRARTEQTFFDRFAHGEREAFASALLVIQLVLEDYRSLVSVALGGLLPPLVIGSFARHPATGQSGRVVGLDLPAGRATLGLGESAEVLTATFDTDELLYTDGRYPLPDAFWSRVVLSHFPSERYAALVGNDTEGSLWAYRWVYDLSGQRAFGLALVGGVHSFAPTPEDWTALIRGTLLARVGDVSSIATDRTPRNYQGVRFFTGVPWPLLAGEPGER